MNGIETARRYYEQVVAPLLRDRWPGLPHAAARLGSGSDVLGLDDEMSRDHDWGLRLTLLVDADDVAEVDALLERELPAQVAGLPVRFATTWDPVVRHRVEVAAVGDFVRSRTGVDPSREPPLLDWLSLTGQGALELTTGPVFADTAGLLTAARRTLEWYPDDIWRYAVATDWTRLEQELPLIGRAGDRGDESGSAVVAARLVDTAYHLGFLLERRWAPYPKWRGTLFGGLPGASGAATDLADCLRARGWHERQDALVRALERLGALQREVGLPTPAAVTGPFFDRPYASVRLDTVDALLDAVVDPAVRALPRGVGTIEQWCGNVDVLTRPDRCRAAVSGLLGPLP